MTIKARRDMREREREKGFRGVYRSNGVPWWVFVSREEGRELERRGAAVVGEKSHRVRVRPRAS